MFSSECPIENSTDIDTRLMKHRLMNQCAALGHAMRIGSFHTPGNTLPRCGNMLLGPAEIWDGWCVDVCVTNCSSSLCGL